MRVVIANTQVPFVRGGAEHHAESLRDALLQRGHQAEIAAIPFKWYPPGKILEHALACRLLDLTEANGQPVDRLIGLKFPAYLVPHPNKVIWILHQYRSAYDLWERPDCDLAEFAEGPRIRDSIRQLDNRFLPEARALYANSQNVAYRLERYNGLSARPLYHPPPEADQFYTAEAEPYFFYPSRIEPLKRQQLLIEALALTREPVVIRFAGRPNTAEYLDRLERQVRKLGLSRRVHFLGAISQDEKRRQYARCQAVLFTPLDEDLGYITLEAMLASKPVLTLSDSGGPLEFVRHGETGIIADPEPTSLARELDRLWREKGLCRQAGMLGRQHYQDLGISWDQVVETLLAD